MTKSSDQHAQALSDILAILGEAGPALTTVQHDLFNTMQTILSSAEFLTMKDHDPVMKAAIIERMNTGASHFESQLKFLMHQFHALREDIVKKVPKPDGSDS